MKLVISKDVECPWCGAKPGEDCTEGGPDGRPQRLPNGRGHLARVEEISKK